MSTDTSTDNIQVCIGEIDESDPTALFCHYDGEYRAQQCELVLDLTDGEFTCRYNPEIGNGRSAGEYHHLVLVTTIPTLTAAAANALLRELAPKAQRVLDGATVGWNGSNHVGRLDDDAAAAWDEIAAHCNPDGDGWAGEVEIVEYTAAGWYAGAENADEIATRLGITADTTDAQLAEMAAAETDEATTCNSHIGHVILTGADQYLTAIRDDLREQLADKLETVAAEITARKEQRDRLITRMRSWGDKERYSLRAIGALADLSHTQVAEIAKAAAESGATKETGSSL